MVERYTQILRKTKTIRTAAVLMMISAATLPVILPLLDPDTPMEYRVPEAGIREIMGSPDHRNILFWSRRLQRSEADPNGFVWGPRATPSCPFEATSYRIENQTESLGIFERSGSVSSGIGEPFGTFIKSNLPDGVHSGVSTVSCMNGENLVESSNWKLEFELKG